MSVSSEYLDKGLTLPSSIQDDEILHSSILNEDTDDKLVTAKTIIFVQERVEKKLWENDKILVTSIFSFFFPENFPLCRKKSLDYLVRG